MSAPDEITKIAEKLKAGQAVEPVGVWRLLSWFGKDRRGWRVVYDIKKVLTEAGIATLPDFDTADYYRRVNFTLVGADGVVNDPTIRIRLLEQAARPVTSCAPQDLLTKVVPMMMTDGFSQIPVITGTREVKGIITWEAIATNAILGKAHATAQDVMVAAEIVDSEEPLSEVIPRIAKAGYVLVRGLDKSIVGIVTSSDLNGILVNLSEAFLNLGEIEGYLRLMVRNKFKEDELKSVCQDPDRAVLGPQDLTLGELIALIESESNWSRLGMVIDRADFIKNLNRVREVRNDVMHFEPDGIDPEDRAFLTKVRDFLRKIVDS